MIKEKKKKSNRCKIVELIEKPIQLNHVLEYLITIVEFSNNAFRVCDLWNLKSNLLSEQSEELIKFLNEL